MVWGLPGKPRVNRGFFHLPSLAELPKIENGIERIAFVHCPPTFLNPRVFGGGEGRGLDTEHDRLNPKPRPSPAHINPHHEKHADVGANVHDGGVGGGARRG